MNADEYARQQREQAIANNDAQHLRHIEQYMRPYVAYCQQRNAIGAAKSIEEYAAAESTRLKDRAELMEKHGIDRLPNTHGQTAAGLLKQAQAYIAEIQADREGQS